MRRRVAVFGAGAGAGARRPAPRARLGLAVVGAAAVALSGCSAEGIGGWGGWGGDSTAATETTTVTSTAAGDGGDDAGRPRPPRGPGEAEPARGRDGGNGRSADAAVGCGVDRDAAVIRDSIATVAAPPAGDYWRLSRTNFDPCGELTYAVFEQMPQGNAQFATKILMFHDGAYLGVDTLNAQQGQIVGEGDGWFEVKYKDWEALARSGQPNAASPNFTTNVTFTWSDEQDKVLTGGRFPN